MARRYPIGIQTFSEIIREGYTYVDKTDLVWKLTNCSIPYQTDGRPVVKVGVKFDAEKRVPEEWIICT